MGKVHRGDLRTAKKLIKTAAKAGVDVVKFQAYELKDLVQDHPNYKRNKLSHFNTGQLHDLKRYADANGVDFWCSCFSLNLFKELCQFTHTVKIPSTFLTMNEYVKEAFKHFKNVHISTGFHDAAKIKHYMERYGHRAKDAESLDNTIRKTTWYHCTSEYPVQGHYNLERIRELGMGGYSHHGTFLNAIIFSWLLGARDIEFHFDLDDSSWRLDQHAVKYLKNAINDRLPVLRDKGTSHKVKDNYDFFKKEFKDLLFHK
jgi:sialic acid synthase SpsE